MMHSQAEFDRGALEKALAARPEVLFAILYGSAAEGGGFRDVDVAVFLDRLLAPAAEDFDYESDLVVLLSAALSLPVDVRIVNDAPLPFRYNVSKGAPLTFRDREAYYRFAERAWDEYLDFKPVAMQYLREMLEGFSPG